MKLDYLRSISKHFGPEAAVHRAVLGAANKIAPFRYLRCFALTMSSRVPHGPPRGYRVGFLGPEILARAPTQAAGEEMDAAFIASALARGDRCYGALHGDTIASFAWYATRATAIADDVWLSFDDDLGYMYKAYTAPEHRGQRLHGACVTRALAEYARDGYRGLVCYIESTNFASIRSNQRVGYRDFGRIVTVELGGRTFVHSTKGCERFGLRLLTRGKMPPSRLSTTETPAAAAHPG
jgi:ribosomal protein S18 acetylase RimI-like enzyme